MIIIKDFNELKLYFKNNLNSDEIIIGMGIKSNIKTYERFKRIFMSLNQELTKKFGKAISNNIKLSNYSWFNLGGPAEYFFKPENKNQLIEFLKESKKQNLKITILGAGSNTLIRDSGIKRSSD